MTNKVIIWDVDGTLIDSYEVLVESIEQVLKRQLVKKIPSKQAIYDYVKKQSVKEYIEEQAKQNNLPYECLWQDYTVTHRRRSLTCPLMPGASQTLMGLADRGYQQYIYTHRGETTYDIMEHHHLKAYFTEIITNKDGFRRKPDPEALVYLIDKYHLSKTDSYYVGDRSLDVVCAKRAGLKSVYFGDEPPMDNSPDYHIRSLPELLEKVVD